MGCLSQQQIAEIALEPGDTAAEAADHVEHCAACRNRLTVLRSLAAQLAEAHAGFDQGHDLARAQLMTVLAAEDRPAAPSRAWNRSTSFLGVLTMSQRIAIGTTGLAAMLAIFFLWGATKPTSAIAEMAENIRKAKSFKATTVFESQLVRKTGEPPVTAVLRSTNYWLAPGSTRSEAKGDENWAGKDEVTVQPAEKPGIDIDHKAKKFRRTPARLGFTSPLTKLVELGNFSGQADRELGDREINGKRATGFEIALCEIDPDAGPGRAEVWIDRKTKLPVLFRVEIDVFGKPANYTMRDFQWNIDLEPKLFEPTPPAGYRDTTPKPPSLAEQVGRVTKGLEIYRELSGGRFPRGNMVYGDVTRDEMFAMIGIHGQPTDEQKMSDKYETVMKAVRGLGSITGILTDNPDAAYHGQTVGPKDADKILLRWRLDDGRYQVIYGDLRDEILPVERLRELERK